MPYRFDKIYMDEDLIENKLYQTIDQYSKRKITLLNVLFILL